MIRITISVLINVSVTCQPLLIWENANILYCQFFDIMSSFQLLHNLDQLSHPDVKTWPFPFLTEESSAWKTGELNAENLEVLFCALVVSGSWSPSHLLSCFYHWQHNSWHRMWSMSSWIRLRDKSPKGRTNSNSVPNAHVDFEQP